MKKPFFLFLAVIVLFLLLRVYHLTASLNFGTDQGIHILEMYKLWHEKKFTLIGPTASFSAMGRSVFTSSLMYYLTLPILLLTNWNILAVSYFLIFLHLGALFFLYRVVAHRINPHTALLFALFYSLLPMMVDYSRFLWNPNFLIPVASLLLALIIYAVKGIKTALLFFGIGVVFGIGLQLHFTFVLAIVASWSVLLFTKKLSLQKMGLLILGFLIGFFPLILFDARHDFYNLRTLLFILTEGSKGKTAFGISPHYFLSLLPFLLYGCAYLVGKWYHRQKILIQIVLTGFILYSLARILPTPDHGFTMVSGWNYAGLLKAEKIIRAQKRENYNIVDVLTGDTRAMALRALLTLSGEPPMDIDQYPAAHSLYIYSKIPIEQIFTGDMWEINFVKPARIIDKWPIQNGIYLYLIQKDSTV